MIDPFLRLPHGNTDPEKAYAFPDPDQRPEAIWSLHQWLFAGGPKPSRDALIHIERLADAYVSLTTYELGQECCVRKLRDIWRARRARR